MSIIGPAARAACLTGRVSSNVRPHIAQSCQRRSIRLRSKQAGGASHRAEVPRSPHHSQGRRARRPVITATAPRSAAGWSAAFARYGCSSRRGLYSRSSAATYRQLVQPGPRVAAPVHALGTPRFARCLRCAIRCVGTFRALPATHTMRPNTSLEPTRSGSRPCPRGRLCSSSAARARPPACAGGSPPTLGRTSPSRASAAASGYAASRPVALLIEPRYRARPHHSQGRRARRPVIAATAPRSAAGYSAALARCGRRSRRGAIALGRRLQHPGSWSSQVRESRPRCALLAYPASLAACAVQSAASEPSARCRPRTQCGLRNR